jgi:hypothetical protein
MVNSVRPVPQFLLHLPSVALQVYLTFTVALFSFGPWPWPLENGGRLYSFLAANQFALWIGYRWGAAYPATGYRPRRSIMRLYILSIATWVSFGTTVLRSRIGDPEFHIASLPGAVIGASSDFGAAYAAKVTAMAASAGSEGGGSSAGTMLGWAAWPLLFPVWPLTVFYWRRLGVVLRTTGLAIITIDAAAWIAVGTLKGLADLAIVTPWMFIAANPWLFTKPNRPRLVRAAAMTTVVLITLTLLFSAIQRSRAAGQVADTDYVANIRIDRTTGIAATLPASVADSYGTISYYLTHGYFGLSLAMNLEADWCYGLGNSFLLVAMSRSILPTENLETKTLAFRVEQRYAWDRFVKWSSLYSWLANDVTFWGVPVIMFGLGGLLAMVWRESLQTRDLASTLLLPLVLIAVIYIPCNNQVLNFAQTFFPFWIYLLLWTFGRAARRSKLQ